MLTPNDCNSHRGTSPLWLLPYAPRIWTAAGAPEATMEKQQPDQAPHTPNRGLGRLARPADSFGLVLLLLILDYIALAAVNDNAWGRVVIVALLGATLLFALRTSRARRIWQLLAIIYLVASTLLTLISVAAPGTNNFSQQTATVGGLLLIVTPFAISRRIFSHRVVTTETVIGAVCVYLLLGFSFTFIYSAIGLLSAIPFFEGVAHATANQYLFFSYTTLTTVGYGNLIPAGNLGQTFAMLEALFGQIYLVIVVARLVSLWGQERPTTAVSQTTTDHDGAGSPITPRESDP
jgi:hypothetical protein